MADDAIKKTGDISVRSLSWHRRIVAHFITFFLRASMATWRCVWEFRGMPPVPDGPVIFCIWHNRLALAVAGYDKFARTAWPGIGVAAMISASRDGAMLAAVVEDFGVHPIRGSSSRRGGQALLEAVTWMEKKYNIAITPDGPRGPAYKVKGRIIDIAKLTGRPIIPFSTRVRWKVCLRSWDRFQIPLPFARCEMQHGAPIYVPPDASEADCEALRQKLEDAMRVITID